MIQEFWLSVAQQTRTTLIDKDESDDSHNNTKEQRVKRFDMMISISVIKTRSREAYNVHQRIIGYPIRERLRNNFV